MTGRRSDYDGPWRLGEHRVGRTGEWWVLDGLRPDHPPGRPHSVLLSALIRQPWADGMWDHFNAELIHLRPVPGLAAAHKRFPAATHELLVFALVPGDAYPPEALPRRMSPANVIAQFVCTDDEVAAEAAALAFDAVTDGWLRIEPGMYDVGGQIIANGNRVITEEWQAALAKTIEHLITGGHP